MAGATEFDKLCYRVIRAHGDGSDYLGRDTGEMCRHCRNSLRAYYCEERLYLVECRECGIKALVKARNPQEAAYKTFAQEVE